MAVEINGSNGADGLTKQHQKNVNGRRGWLVLFILTVLSVYFYVFLEWLFFATKPSFLDVLRFWDKLSTFLITGFILTILLLSPFFLLLGVSKIPFLSRYGQVFLIIGGLIPALVLSAASLLLVDNFTYTVFQFGVVTSQGLFRAVYGLFFLIVMVIWYRWTIRRIFLAPPSLDHPKIPAILPPAALALGLLLVSSILLLPRLDLPIRSIQADDVNLSQQPNILLLGSDGLNASSMSLYGYERDTTPFLKTLAETSLVAENAFSNAGNTTGSTTSMLTDKLPTETKVVYPPDILRGVDAYQHLPGILRQHGYETVQVTIFHYADAYTLNMLDGFDIANNKAILQQGVSFLSHQPALQDVSYLIASTEERVSERVFHIFFIRSMSNPYAEVTDGKVLRTDDERVSKVLGYLKNAEKPIFIHAHLLGTHGEQYKPRHRVFSAGERQDALWMTDFYDDSILDFDSYVSEVVAQLKEMGIYDNTILIIYTDHNQQFRSGDRIPLMIHFPNDQFAGSIRNNVQNLDIAPTVLDYMGLPVPSWFDGQSLLKGEPDPARPIYSTGVGEHIQMENGLWIVDPARAQPPFYQFGYFQAIVCNQRYYVNLHGFQWTTSEIDGVTTTCDEGTAPDEGQVQELMLEHLAKTGFDISALRQYLVTQNSIENNVN